MAGVVIAVASGSESSVEPLIERGACRWWRSTGLQARDVDSVVVDNRAGAAEATRHLIDRGCTPCRLHHRTDSGEHHQRTAGWLSRAIVAAGLSVDARRPRADFKEAGGTRPRVVVTGRKRTGCALHREQSDGRGALRAFAISASSFRKTSRWSRSTIRRGPR